MKERYYDPGVAEFIGMTCQLYGTTGLDPEDCIQEGWAAYLTFRQTNPYWRKKRLPWARSLCLVKDALVELRRAETRQRPVTCRSLDALFAPDGGGWLSGYECLRSPLCKSPEDGLLWREFLRGLPPDCRRLASFLSEGYQEPEIRRCLVFDQEKYQTCIRQLQKYAAHYWPEKIRNHEIE